MTTAAASPIRVLIVDDHATVRQGLRLFFAGYPGIVIVGEAATCTEALTAAGQTQPDIIVLDLAFGHANAVDFIPEFMPRAFMSSSSLVSMILLSTSVRCTPGTT